MPALAAPASLKGVLTPHDAAAQLAGGFRAAGVDAAELPVADGGEGTAAVVHAALGGAWRAADVHDALGRPVTARWLVLDDGTAVVDSAEAIGLPQVGEERDPLRATSRGLGELLGTVLGGRPAAVLVCVGGTATVDGGAGMIAALDAAAFAVPVRVACDVRNPLLGERGAARVFAPQKGADARAVEELEARLAARADLAPYRHLRGAGAGGGLGAAFASLGAELLDGAELVLELVGFDAAARDADLVVTGEGTVDATTFEGKAPGAVARHCARLGVPCALFGGVVRDGIDAHVLSGDPDRAAADLFELGERLGRGLVAPR